MSELERMKGWAIGWALIAVPMTWLAWWFTNDAFTRWAIVAWVVFCLGITWLAIRFNWRTGGPDAEFPYADGLLREPFPPSPGSPPPRQS